jgi:hypothetical protein
VAVAALIHQVVELGCLVVVVVEPLETAHHRHTVECQLRQDKEIKAVIINHLAILEYILELVAVVVQVALAAWAD